MSILSTAGKKVKERSRMFDKITKKVASPFDIGCMWSEFILAVGSKLLALMVNAMEPRYIKAWFAIIYVIDKE
jgi:hypothetical protein